MPFTIVEAVPEYCVDCEHYSGHTGCHHPQNGGGVAVNEDWETPPPSNCPIRLGWPRYYILVPLNFPEPFVPTVLCD